MHSYSTTKYRERAPIEQEELDLRSIRIVRAMIHNVIVLLPDNWSNSPKAYSE